MADFPGQAVSFPRVAFSTVSPTTPMGALSSHVAVLTSTVWPAADRALYIAFHLDAPFQVQKLAVLVGIQSGNLDMGIYDEWGNRIVSKGSTAVAAAGNQVIDLTTSVTGTASPALNPGTYWVAMNVDNTTASFRMITTTAQILMCGCVQQQAVGAVTLPATASFANPASNYLPYILISGNTVT